MNKKRIGIVFLVMTLLAGCLTGCAGKGNTTGDGETFSYFTFIGNASTLVTNLGDTEMYKELEKQTGVHINFEHPLESSAFNVMFASGEYPDMIEHDWSSYPGAEKKACEDGILIDLTDMMEEHAPNYLNFIKNEVPEALPWITTDGRFYTITNLASYDNYTSVGGLLIRKDLLDKYGLEVPKTILDWENVLSVFKANGVKYPVTMTTSNLISYAPFMGAYDVVLNYYQDEDVMKYGYVEPELKEFTELFSRWYKEGLVDPDIATHDNNTMKGKISNGEVGAWCGNLNDITKYTKILKEIDPAAEVVAAPYPVLEEGGINKIIFMDRVEGHTWANQVGITTACKNPEKALEWLDYAFTPEGHMLFNFGIEGKSYEIVDGKPQYTELVTNNPDGLDFQTAVAMYARPNSPGYIDEAYMDQLYKEPRQAEAAKMWSKNANAYEQAVVWRSRYKFSTEESEKINSITLNYADYAKENFFKFITGIKPMSEYDAYVAELNKMGVPDVVKIYQTAYDRSIK